MLRLLVKRAAVAAALAALGVVVGCNSLLGNDPWTLDQADAGSGGPPPPGDAASGDTGIFSGDDSPVTPGDSAADVATDTGFDSNPDTGDDASTGGDGDAGGDADGSGLSPLLVLPPPGGASCDPLQGDADCSTGLTCRISSVTWGTCDSVTSGHEAGWPCAVDQDCDDTLQCYNGKCHVLCPLGMMCSGGCACFSVGNVDMGLCCPGL